MEELEEAAWVYGLLPTETADWSPRELLQFVEAGSKRRKQEASLLYIHAGLCRKAMDGKMPEVWEAFPFWTQEEIYQAKVERIRGRLMKHVK